MASRSFFLPRLAVAALAIVVLALGCRTDQESFHYSGDPGEEVVGPSDLVVKIGEDCHVDKEQELVTLDTEATGERGSYDQVLWHIQSGDRVVISAKPAEEQDPKNPEKGRVILGAFQAQYDIPAIEKTPPNNAIRSGKPQKTPLLLKLLHKDKKAVWKYGIDYYRGGQKLCSYDPAICIQKPGTDSCSMMEH